MHAGLKILVVLHVNVIDIGAAPPVVSFRGFPTPTPITAIHNRHQQARHHLKFII